jgi:hypothetical protein
MMAGGFVPGVLFRLLFSFVVLFPFLLLLAIDGALILLIHATRILGRAVVNGFSCLFPSLIVAAVHNFVRNRLKNLTDLVRRFSISLYR